MTTPLNKVFFFSSISALLITCTPYEFPDSPYAKIETISVANITQEGVTFQGSINKLSSDEIIDHGFIFGLVSTLKFGDLQKVSLGTATETGAFEHVQKTELYSDTTYYVQAYVVTDSYTAFGDILSFDSKGGAAPLITSFLPNEATWGDTLIIKGRYFSRNPNATQVKFASYKAKIINSNDTTIWCIIPSDISEKETPLFVTSMGKQTQSSMNFIFSSPIITSFLPTTGTFGDIITVAGQNFSNDPTKNIVKLNNLLVEVLESTTSQLKIKVPNTIIAQDNSISVTVNLQSSSSPVTFRMLAPIINGISATEGFIGETIRINGNNFNPSIFGNNVSLGGTQASILNASKTHLSIEIPAGIYKSRSFAVEVNTTGQSTISNELFSLQNAWIQKANYPVAGFENYGTISFSINEMGYVGLGGLNTSQKTIYLYNPVENSWSSVPQQFPGESRVDATSFVIEDKAYVGLGGFDSFNATKNFYRYDPTTGSWTQVADFPYPTTKAIGLSLNGKGYVITTSNIESNFWEYDPLTDSWSSRASIPISDEMDISLPSPVTGFIIEDRLFIYSQSESSFTNQLWEYNFVTNAWVDKETFTLNESETNPRKIGFSLNEFGYIAGDQALHRYNPLSNSWTAYNDFQNPSGHSSVFVIDNKIYIGTMGGFLFEFDPVYE